MNFEKIPVNKIPENIKDLTPDQLKNVEKYRKGTVDPEELRRQSLEKLFKGQLRKEDAKNTNPSLGLENSNKEEIQLTPEERAKINLAKYKEGKIQGKSIEQLKQENLEKLKNPGSKFDS